MNRVTKGLVTLRTYFFYFMFASVVGYIYEFLLDNLYYQHPYTIQGPLHGPWLMIYGFGGIAIIALVKKFGLMERKHTPAKMCAANRKSAGLGSANKLRKLNLMPLVLFVVMFFLFGSIEFGAHFILDTFFDFRPWDYSAKPLNLYGRTCFEDVFRFTLLGMLCLFAIVPVLDRQLARLSAKGNKATLLLLLIVATPFVFDCVYSLFFPLTV